MKKNYDIGVVGCWYWGNYGSILNGYATFSILKSFGLAPLNIVTPHNGFEPHAKRFFEIAYNVHDLSEVLPFERVHEYNNICNNFLTGSDQIWNYNPNATDRRYANYFKLDFADDDKRKISFATSFGRYIPEPAHILEINERLFKRYSAISVREQESVNILAKSYGINGVRLLEPVFDVDKNVWDELAEHSKYKETEPYLLTYILDPTPEKRKAIEYYAGKLGIKAINILDGFSRPYQKNKELLNLPNTLPNISAHDMLKYFQNAEFVLTDSFHGACFSVIYNKTFIAIQNIGRGVERFKTLLSMTGLNERLVSDGIIPLDEKYLSHIDFSYANQIIAKEKEKAVSWLKNVIEEPKDKLPGIIISKNKAAEQLHQNPEFIKIRLLATLLRDYGVKHVVLSPGGRDVPIVRMFENNEDSFILHRVTDERSAAYYGMGIAAQLRKPVVCVCTSGTAASNYLPAVTEAYYTGVPLIVVTADRRQVYLNHGEDQTIPQKHIYADVTKREITVPEGAGYNAEYQTRRDISDCILETTHNGFGPVHINIAITDISIGANISKEHWKLLPHITPHILRVSTSDGAEEMMRWVNALKKSTKILVVYGQNPPPTEKQLKNIEKFASKYNCAIVTDFISNLDCAYSLKPYNMLQAISNEEFNNQLSPDILITVGGKRLMGDPLTYKIRGGLKNIRHWSVEPSGKIKDFYFRLTSVLEMSQDFFFEWFSAQAGDVLNNGVYYNKWREMTGKYIAPDITRFDAHYIQSKFIPRVPENSMLHLGVGQSFIDSRRYSMKKNVEVFCNMGTNGIDGCTSTFMGQCSVIKDKLCFLLVGDLSFFYDMNSIWNKKPGKNVRILMVNNSGSGLLRGNNLKAVTAAHNTSAQGWVESVNFEYMSAKTKEEYDEKLTYFMSDEPEEAVFFEVFCI